ncbi:RNA-splicing factor [Rhodotorula sphaerocarpa]
MSYNGIGLSTPRGSGTSGHIQANRSALRQRDRPRHDGAADLRQQSFASRAPDQAILDHERKRAVEAKCFELQVSLEDDGVEPAEIESQVAALRERLLAQQSSSTSEAGTAIKPHERHQLAQAKQEADARMRKALGIRDDFVEGAAFDRDLQEQLKLQRQAERERAREERAKIEEELRAERARALAAREAQRRRHDDDMARERRRQQDELEQSRRDHADRMRASAGAPSRLPYDGDDRGRPLPVSLAPPRRQVPLRLALAVAATAQETERQPAAVAAR